MERDGGVGESPLFQRLFWLAAAGGTLLIFIMRVRLGAGLPLWLDESWTAMIASQSSWHDVFREAWLDCNAPLYYIVMHVWASITGVSNDILRLPSLIFVMAAAIAPLVWKIPGVSRDARIAWAALLFCWWPATFMALEARSYGLLLFLSVLQSLAFIQLIDRIDGRRIHCWCALAALSFATHYFAAVIIAVQAAMLLWQYRLTPFRYWHAALWFVPILGWLFFHLPRLADYTRPGIAWYQPFGWDTAFGLMAFPFGPPSSSFIAGLALLCAVLLLFRRKENTRAKVIERAILSAILALGLLLLIDAFRPTVANRYLTPVVPLMLLALVHIGQVSRRPCFAFTTMIIFYLVAGMSVSVIRETLDNRSLFGFEPELEAMLPAKPDRIAFTWESPGTLILDPQTLSRLGEFYFRRAGYNTTVTPFIVGKGEDVDARLAHEAGKRPDAILWLYGMDPQKPHWQPATLAALKNWDCRNYAKNNIGVLNCRLVRKRR